MRINQKAQQSDLQRLQSSYHASSRRARARICCSTHRRPAAAPLPGAAASPRVRSPRSQCSHSAAAQAPWSTFPLSLYPDFYLCTAAGCPQGCRRASVSAARFSWPCSSSRTVFVEDTPIVDAISAAAAPTAPALSAAAPSSAPPLAAAATPPLLILPPPLLPSPPFASASSEARFFPCCDPRRPPRAPRQPALCETSCWRDRAQSLPSSGGAPRQVRLARALPDISSWSPGSMPDLQLKRDKLLFDLFWPATHSIGTHSLSHTMQTRRSFRGIRSLSFASATANAVVLTPPKGLPLMMRTRRGSGSRQWRRQRRLSGREESRINERGR